MNTNLLWQKGTAQCSALACQRVKLISFAFMHGIIDTGVDVKLIVPLGYAVVCVYILFL